MYEYNDGIFTLQDICIGSNPSTEDIRIVGVSKQSGVNRHRM